MSVLTTQIPAYLYQQYQGDADIAAFFTAYNTLSQSKLDTISQLNLPIYLTKSGDLLNIVGEGLYGEIRTPLATGITHISGMFNTYEYNENENNQYNSTYEGVSYQVNDDVYKKIIQWNTFKGDGKYMTIRWLKRRIYRFFYGTNFPDQTYQIDVRISGDEVTIRIPSSFAYADVFNAAIASNALILPFQYTYVVILV